MTDDDDPCAERIELISAFTWALHEALRKQVIHPFQPPEPGGYCVQCGHRWHDASEVHAPDCLAKPMDEDPV